MSEYTPTVGELRQAYVEASGASMAQESYYAEQMAEFERGIARIKAEALREAADHLSTSQDRITGLHWHIDKNRVRRLTDESGYLNDKADQIEKEAGL